jgi:glycosyltransferase involved in cell wall biosynthesis
MTEMFSERRRYVLVTAAYNEKLYLDTLIRSILAQTLRPLRWVIVSDGSTDGTDAIVRQYSAQNEFIELVRITEDHPRNFAAQVYAINAGLARLEDTEYDFIGNVDADMSFEPDYFSDLLDVFANDPALGLAGGSIYEMQAGEFQPRPLNREASVAHAVQLFRRKCFEDLGGRYLPLPHGGPDTYADVCSRMNGWRVRSIHVLKAYHYRPTGGATGWMRGSFRQGRMDYSLGIHPFFEICRLLLRVGSRPWVLYAGIRLAGFCFSYCILEKRMVSREFVRFLRKEEVGRIRHLVMRRTNPKTEPKLYGEGIDR